MHTSISSPADSEFLQSSLWEQVQKTEGIVAMRFGSALFVERKVPFFGTYWYSPRGPFHGESVSAASLRDFFSPLMKQAKEKHAGWIRIDVNSTAEKDALKKFFGDAVFLSSPHSMQPRTVLDTDIRGSEEDMLLHMKPKTRYNIRLAKKKKVEISVDSGATRIDEFYKLVKTASDRAGIAAHPKSHYETIVRVLPRENVSLYFASYRNVTVAAALVIFYKENALYLHGGSSNYFREAMAPYLLHFQVMLDAKRRGCNIYSFGGIQENGDAEKSSWAGITRFKTGFSPKTGVVRTVGSYDIVIAPFRYGLYRLFGKIFSLVKWLRKQVGRILK